VAVFGAVCAPWRDGVLYVLQFHAARVGGGMSWQAVWSAFTWIDTFADLSAAPRRMCACPRTRPGGRISPTSGPTSRGGGQDSPPSPSASAPAGSCLRSPAALRCSQAWRMASAATLNPSPG